MLQMHHPIVYYWCHHEWGEGKALPVIVRRVWTDAEMGTFLQLSPLSPPVFLLGYMRMSLTRTTWPVNLPYSWSGSWLNGTANARALWPLRQFWTDKRYR